MKITCTQKEKEYLVENACVADIIKQCRCCGNFKSISHCAECFKNNGIAFEIKEVTQ